MSRKRHSSVHKVDCDVALGIDKARGDREACRPRIWPSVSAGSKPMSPAGTGAARAPSAPRKPTSARDCGYVCQRPWLKELGLSEYASAFADNDIDFAI